MKLTVKTVNRKLTEFQEVKSLLKRVFPKNEQIPRVLLLFRAFDKDVKFLAYYDSGVFAGLVMMLRRRVLFLFYIWQ
ncbi:MAG: hypothetical protein IAC55_05210 [Tyzzerella sp.]|uniref:Uncharacterized protein n=1 Tax=Candidatus Fimicola merdigallinarum TaxID=2840819 RepID=A0A9D9DV51_9FIRM|nr:hypothetical protein [Candidatus Fimicola merdigallinarum]